MNHIAVLIVVDTDGALASRSLVNNCYMVDTNGYLGSWVEGTPTLQTVCQDGQELIWSAAPLIPTGDVSIAGFSGAMVTQGICTPEGADQDQLWAGQVQARGAFSFAPYTLTLNVTGVDLQTSCDLKIV
jgi:hypothetical protein